MKSGSMLGLPSRLAVSSTNWFSQKESSRFPGVMFRKQKFFGAVETRVFGRSRFYRS